MPTCQPGCTPKSGDPRKYRGKNLQLQHTHRAFSLMLNRSYFFFIPGWHGSARPRNGFRDPGQDPAGGPLRPHTLQEAGASRHLRRHHCHRGLLNIHEVAS